MTRRGTRILAADIGGGHASAPPRCWSAGEPTACWTRNRFRECACGAWHQGRSAVAAPAGPGHCQRLYQLAARSLSDGASGALLSSDDYGPSVERAAQDQVLWRIGVAAGSSASELVRCLLGALPVWRVSESADQITSSGWAATRI